MKLIDFIVLLLSILIKIYSYYLLLLRDINLLYYY